MSYDFTTTKMLLELCDKNDCNMGEIMIRREMELFDVSREFVVQKMSHALEIMENAIQKSLTEKISTMGGLIGGEAKNLHSFHESGKSFCGNLISKAITYAMGTLEVNASMGLIVAAPTAGASGVLPAVLISLKEEYNFSHDEIISALFTASAIGFLFAKNATISGAEGGCQAEVGTASAMASACVVQLFGGNMKTASYASASAITHVLGLVCDPIFGLVEAPCQGRNAMGATNAIISAQMALANAVPKIELDEVISTMYNVGKTMPCELRETALGGIATCPSAKNCKSCHQ